MAPSTTFPLSKSLILLLNLHIISSYILSNFSLHDLERNDQCFFADAVKWTATPTDSSSIVTQFNGNYLVGGFDGFEGINQSGRFLTRTYDNLPPHSMIYFSFTLYVMGSWSKNVDFLQIQFDSKIFNSTKKLNYNFLTSNPLENTQKDLFNMRVFGRVKHEDPDLTFEIISQFDSESSKKSIGIRNVNMLFVENPISALPTEEIYHKTSLSSDDCPCLEGQYEDPILGCTSCHASCSACFGPGANQCYECKTGFDFDGTNCFACASGCAACNGDASKQCTTCQPGYLLFNNSTCLPESNCVAPLTQTGCNTYCELPHDNPSNDYYEEIEGKSEYKKSISMNERARSRILEEVKPATLSRLLHYVVYIDVQFPSKLNNSDVSPGNNILSLRVTPTSFREILSLPQRLLLSSQTKEVNESFLYNCIDDLFILLCVIMIAIVAMFSEVFTKKLQWFNAKSVFQTIENIMWNLSLMLFVMNIGDFVFFVGMEIKHFSGAKNGAIIYIWACIIMILSILGILIAIASLVYQAQSIKKQAESTGNKEAYADFEDKWKGYQVLFAGYKTTSWVTQGFYFIYCIRLIMPMMIMSWGIGVPIAEVVLLITVVNVPILVYLIWQRPISSLLNLLNIIITETIILLINACILALAILDDTNDQNEEVRDTLGDIISAANLCIDINAIVFLILKLSSGVLKACKLRKKNSPHEKTAWVQLIFIPFQQGTLGFEHIEVMKRKDLKVFVFPLVSSNGCSPVLQPVYPSPNLKAISTKKASAELDMSNSQVMLVGSMDRSLELPHPAKKLNNRINESNIFAHREDSGSPDAMDSRRTFTLEDSYSLTLGDTSISKRERRTIKVRRVESIKENFEDETVEPEYKKRVSNNFSNTEQSPPLFPLSSDRGYLVEDGNKKFYI